MFSRIRKIFTEYRELRYLAYHDPLTGVLNRNWLYKNITNIKCVYIYFIDINDLRVINKRGHTFGDKHIVRCVAEINITDGDYLIRYAGDEFILFTDNENAINTNRLFSVGCCENSGCISDAINLADSRMIKSKLLWKSKNLKQT